MNWPPGSVTFRRGKRECAFPPARKCELSVNGGKSLAGARTGRREGTATVHETFPETLHFVRPTP